MREECVRPGVLTITFICSCALHSYYRERNTDKKYNVKRLEKEVRRREKNIMRAHFILNLIMHACNIE